MKGKRYLAVFTSATLLLAACFALAACGGGNDYATSTTAPQAAAGGTTGQSVAVATNSTLGKILVNAQGMTLYRFDKDSSGASNCSGTCAQNWPPLAASSATPQGGAGVTGTLGTITRADGTKQVTYNGSPLYTFKTDKKSGDVTGDGVNGFHVVSP